MLWICTAVGDHERNNPVGRSEPFTQSTREQDIGDVDDDGAQEFLDRWGNPISFVHFNYTCVGKPKS